MMLYRTAIIAMSSALLLAGSAQSETIEGKVTAIMAGGELQIDLPVGAQVSQGDKVTILSEIPGLGPVAIATRWNVVGAQGRTVTATPEAAPSGTPQVGYIAHIETSAGKENAPSIAKAPRAGATSTDPMVGQNFPDHHAISVSPEAMNLYLAAEDLANSSAPSDLANAIDLYRRAADMGHTGAMSELGAALSFGRGINRDDKAAFDWQMRAAEQGNPKALLRLGLIHSTGRGTVANAKVAAGWVKQAAYEGSVDAMFLLGMLYEDGTGVEASMTELVRWFDKAAQHGHTDAMFLLGAIYENGEDGVIPKDIYKTELYWLKAANAGHVGAMRELSAFYEGKSERDAKKWAEASRNSAGPPVEDRDLRCLSQWECYIGEPASSMQKPTLAPTHSSPSIEPEAPAQTERTVKVIYTVQDCDRYAASPRDPDRPDTSLSVEYSDIDAQQVIAECQGDIQNWPDTRRFYTQIARGYHKLGQYQNAYNAAMTGANMGSSQGMTMIGMLHKLGQSVPKDAGKALEWLEKAAHKDNITAMHFAASMHLHSDGVPYNPQAAFSWFKTAADMGNSDAYANLGILMDNGQGVPYNAAKAAANLVKGFDGGSAVAQKQLLQTPDRLTKQTRIEIQKILNRQNRYHGTNDGSFGPKTMEALHSTAER